MTSFWLNLLLIFCQNYVILCHFDVILRFLHHSDIIFRADDSAKDLLLEKQAMFLQVNFSQFCSYHLQFVILNKTLKNVISGRAKNTPNRAFMIIRCFVYALGPVCAIECVYNSSLVLKCLGS